MPDPHAASSSSTGRARLHPRHPGRAWGETRRGIVARAAAWLRRVVGGAGTAPRDALPELPVALRRSDLAGDYLAAQHAGDHRRAASVCVTAMERAVAAGEWWPADAWAHRALWHFERAGLTLHAARQARRIGDLRWAAGDPDSARRYYAEAIAEARDIGAEHEQGLASLGLGRALLDLGDATAARRLARASAELLERSGAPAAELDAARELHGAELPVGGEGGSA